MKFFASLPLLAALVHRASGAGEGQWFAYFNKGGLGPNRWSLLQVPANQCGGNIRDAPFVEYGQSPVAVETTDGDCKGKFDYDFTAGDCKFSDLKFSISNNGVKVEPKNDCLFGKMKIPHFPEPSNGTPRLSFKAVQFHIHTKSEHTIDGEFFEAELHVVHLSENRKGTPYAVWGAMMTGDATVDHPIFEDYLRGWEMVADAQEKACASPEEVGQNTYNPVVDEAITTGSDGCYSQGVGKTNWDPQPLSSNGTVSPDIYRQLISNVDGTFNPDYGSFTYKGGLTTPPCTQIVNWNLMDDYIRLSPSQMERLQRLIWCYVEPSCNHATAADRDGSTSRPPQPLMGREVIHRCQDCAGCEDIVDTAPPPPEDGDGFQKPEPEPENPNTKQGQCNKVWTKGCPEDKRANPNVSPNLKANAPVWNDIEGLWIGRYSATDRNGVPLTENFVNPKLTVELPYDRSTVFMARNVTIKETRYYEHIYYIYNPADSTPNSELTGVKFCTLPKLVESANVLGKGTCGVDGWTAYSERFGTATHEKDGVAQIFAVTGRFQNASQGNAVPVADKSIYISMSGDRSKITETVTFTNDDRTKVGGSGQVYLFEDFEPYKSNPHESTFTYFLDQTDEEGFKAAINEAYESHSVTIEEEQLPNPMMRECLAPQCPTQGLWAQNDPLSTPTPYDENASASGWFIAVMVIIAVIVLLIILWFLHKRQVAKQKDRISRQFARRVAETIKVEGSHTQLSPEALEEEFKRIDTDHNGYLTKSELKAFVNSGKIGTMTDSDFNALFAALDVDGNGTVDFTEFCAFMAQCGNVYDEIEMDMDPEDRRKSIARRVSRMGSAAKKDEEAPAEKDEETPAKKDEEAQ